MNALKSSVLLHQRAARSLGSQIGLQKLACSDLQDRATPARQVAPTSSGTGVISRSFYHSSIKQESTLILGGAGLLVGSVLVGKLIDMSAANPTADAETPETPEGAGKAAEGAEDAAAPAADVSESDENTSKAANVEDTNAPAQENTAKSKVSEEEEKAKAKAKAARKADKDKKAGQTAFVDELMADVYTAFGKDWKEAKAGFFAKNFYDGGFEDKMTRREAALILGVRENTAIQRIKESHRKVLLLNHPDRGGSPYVAAKINLAKDLLLKGK